MSNTNFIEQFYLDDISLCDEIIEFFKNSENKKHGTVGKNGEVRIEKTIKNSIDCMLFDNVELAVKYINELQKCVEKYKKIYPCCDQYGEWRITDNINVQYYEPNGGYYAWHTERINADLPNATRHLVFITYLNDVDDQGETEFLYQELKVKPRKGLTVIWPADWTFTHRGVPSPTQEKYIVTGWFNFI